MTNRTRWKQSPIAPWAHALGSGVWVLLLGACAASLPAAGVATGGAASNDGATKMARALNQLAGGAGELVLRPSTDGAHWEVAGPAAAAMDELGSGLLATHTAPKPAEIDATFGQYCKLRGAPERRAHEGFTRLTYRGNERRSGAECTLVADLPKAGRWRFVLRVQRNGSPLAPRGANPNPS